MAGKLIEEFARYIFYEAIGSPLLNRLIQYWNKQVRFIGYKAFRLVLKRLGGCKFLQNK
jgi:hypothetical protein